ncbi:tRNA dihydrouridine synthase [Candidatus Dependentiae bacterium]
MSCQMSYWKEKLKIKHLEFPRFLGAPLDGVTDSPFRKLVRQFSTQELLYTEMRHVACVANEKGEQKSIKFEQLERPLNYQFAANKVEYIERACDLVLQKGVDSIDLNVGCPARNLISSGSGSALMQDVPRLKEILNCFREKLKDMPFTVKIRAGFKKENALEVAKLAQDCGADAIAIHPRLQTQKFQGVPDYSLAQKLKKELTIPVIISGGIIDFKTAKMVYEQTGVDGFLIGRGMWSKPWKLKELREHSLGNEFTLDKTIILACALSHLDNIVNYYGPDGVYAFRKHVPFYLKGMESSCNLKNLVFSTTSVEKIKAGFTQFFEQYT